MIKVSVTEKNVHNKALFTKLDDHIHAMIALLDIVTDIDDVISLIEMVLLSEAEYYKLEQINVISDKRNNIVSEVRNGKIIIDIFYKHKNCFNITQLSYTLQR